MVKIYIVDLSVMCLIGIYPEERAKKQKLIFNIEINSSSIDCSKDDITKQLAEFASKKTKQKFEPIAYRHKEQYTIALDVEPILKKIK